MTKKEKKEENNGGDPQGRINRPSWNSSDQRPAIKRKYELDTPPRNDSSGHAHAKKEEQDDENARTKKEEEPYYDDVKEKSHIQTTTESKAIVNDQKDEGRYDLRNSKFEQLMVLPETERLQQFDALPELAKIELLWPSDDVQQLPPRDLYPDGWEDMVSKAVSSTVEYAKTEFPERVSTRQDFDSDSDTDLDDDDDDDHMGADMDVPFADVERSDPNHFNAIHFSKMLRFCIPMTLGFHISLFSQNNFCFCPCGKDIYMARWQQLCAVQGWINSYFQTKQQPRCNCSKKSPAALLSHVETLADACQIHRLILHYLRKLYENYHETGIRHIAFEKLNDPSYKKTQKILFDQVTRYGEGFVTIQLCLLLRMSCFFQIPSDLICYFFPFWYVVFFSTSFQNDRVPPPRP